MSTTSISRVGTFDVATYEARRRAATRRRTGDAALGIGLIVALALVVGVIAASFSGRFTRYVRVSALIPTGQPATVGTEVEYDQVQVGKVATAGKPVPGGGAEVVLHMDPSMLASIPANVVAQILPSSLFGSTALVLTSATPAETARLAARSIIPAAGGPGGSLQGTLVDLNNLLTGLHPAQIDTTLGALTEAFQGQAPALHDFVGQVDKYVAQMLPQLSTVESDFALLTPVLDGFSISVPNLLRLAGNASTTAGAITRQSAHLLGLLHGGSGTASVAANVLSQIQDSLHGFAANLLPLLNVVGADPSKLPQIVSAVTKWAAGWSAAETDGPWINVTSPYSAHDFVPFAVSGLNLLPPAENQALTQQGNADRLAIPPNASLPYTAADCPRYGDEQGPNCPGATATTATSASVGMANPAQLDGAAEMAAAIDGGATGAGSPVAASLLQPLLESLVP